jgi:hypothetical protein
MYVFRLSPKINIGCFPKQPQLVGFCNGDAFYFVLSRLFNYAVSSEAV